MPVGPRRTGSVRSSGGGSPPVTPFTSRSTTSVTSSAKRKRVPPPKFYAVRAGRTPGLYYSWADCVAQTEGFQSAVFKSFTTLSDAEAFMSGAPTPSTTKSGKQKFYGVQRGITPGVYTDWDSAQAQIKGAVRPKYKAFSTKAEAEAFVSAGGGPPSSSNGELELESVASMAAGRKGCKVGDSQQHASKRQKKNDSSADSSATTTTTELEPGMTPLDSDAEDGFDRKIVMNPKSGKLQWKTEEQLNARKLQATSEAPDKVLRIWTDGSALGNGRVGAVAGVGVFFGPGDERNVSEALTGSRATNQRAELTAILRALDLAPLDRHVLILTDSKYSIECSTSWAKRWKENGWVTASKKPVENRDLIEPIINKIAERKQCKVETNFEWLKGHAGVYGNEQADALAVAGAKRSREE